MEGLSPLSPGRMLCLAAVGGSQVAQTCEEVEGGGGSDVDPPAGFLGEIAPRGGNKPLWEPKFPSERRGPLPAHLQLNFIFFG